MGIPRQRQYWLETISGPVRRRRDQSKHNERTAHEFPPHITAGFGGALAGQSRPNERRRLRQLLWPDVESFLRLLSRRTAAKPANLYYPHAGRDEQSRNRAVAGHDQRMDGGQRRARWFC